MKPRKPARPDDEALTAPECRRRAMDLLARREHGRRELAGKLAQRGFPAEVIDPVLETLAAEGLLSEGRFAESFVTARVARGHGAQRIRAELAERGVDGALIDQALEAAAVDWRALAEQVRQRRFGAEPPADARAWSRQARFLRYRGFSGEQIRAVLGEPGG